MSEKVTIRKLAAEIGIASSTVYRALSGHHSVRTETRRKVLRAAHKNGYLLPVHGKDNVAIIVPSFFFGGYLECLLPCLEKEFHRRGFRLQLIPVGDVDFLEDYMFSGIVSLVWQEGLEKSLPQNFTVPILILNGASNQLENIPGISSDPKGIRMALDYLWDRGCRRIFYISSVADKIPDAAERLAEFRKFCIDHDQDYDALHLESHWSSIDDKISLILEAAPDACFCAGESFAVRIGQLLKASGKRIPEDISLMGLEDNSGNRHFSPPITAIRQNFERMAEAAADWIASSGKHKETAIDNLIPFTLIERRSVRQPDSGQTS